MGEKIPGEKIGVDGMLTFVPPSQVCQILLVCCNINFGEPLPFAFCPSQFDPPCP